MAASIHPAYLRLILAGAQRIGFDATVLLQVMGLDQAQLDDPQARIPLEATRTLWATLVERTGDGAVGLRLARAAQGASAGALEYVARNSPTMGELLGTIAQYARLLNTGAVIDIDPQPEWVVVSYHVLERHDVHHAATDFALSYPLYRARERSTILTPTAVELTQARPADDSRYVAVFGERIEWRRPMIKACFTYPLWNTPIVSPDSELARVMRGVVEQQLAQLPPVHDVSAQIKVELLRSCEGSAPTLAEMAKRLGLSTRSLQRRLKDADTTYRALSARVRMEFAADLLRSDHLSLAEVAFVVGFSEPSAFHRAFRKAYGVTPTEYRSR